jgi:hypothetical protein
LPFGTDEIVIVLVQATSLPTDATFQGAQFLSQVLTSGTGAGVEATFTNYGRIHIGTPATISIASHVRSADIPDQVINAAGGALNNSLGALLICWRKTTATADSATRLLSKHNFTYSTTGGNLPIAIPSIGSAA